MNINILYDYYYDFDKNVLTIGGIQSYIQSLIRVCQALGHCVAVYQFGDASNKAKLEDYNVFGIKITKRNKYQSFSEAVANLTDRHKDIYIFATDSLIPESNPFKHSIALQHGINWDMPRSKSRNQILMQLSKARRNYNIMRKVNNVDLLVCVDYNFVNWMRAQSDRVEIKMAVIPNYTQVAPIVEKPSDRINVIFARRFWWYRGTRVFTEAVKRICMDNKNVYVIIAGSGPDEAWMHSELDKYENVIFTSYSSNESLSIHADKHIAVVPTVGSEGTSLSLLEAMSAQCAVVASDVGGVTNILLDGYNGLIVPAGDPEKLYEAIRFYIENENERKQIAMKGYETVKMSFSLEKWEKSWKTLLEDFIVSSNN